MGFTLKCPMPGCSGQLSAETKEDLLKQATDHAKTAHAMPMIPPNVMSQIQGAIKQT
jgi:predicted small metal-binding protein